MARSAWQPALLVLLGTAISGCGDAAVALPADAATASGPASGAGGAGGGPPLEPAVEIRTPDGEVVTRLLWGEPFEVHVVGVAPGAEVIVRGRVPGFESYGVFQADEGGNVDTASTAPASGTWDDADSDGIVWSMAPLDPLADGNPGDPSVATFDAEVGAAVVASGQIERFRQADGVTQVEVDDAAIVGVYFTPPGPGPHPAMLVFGGSEGGLSYAERRAPYLASLGYATLGVAYFAAPGVPASLSEIPLEYFAHALDWLRARAEVDPDRVGVMGGSRGGELTLLLARHFPEIRAAVAGIPSGVSWPGYSGTEYTAAWTLAGEPVPYVHGGGNAQQITGPYGEKLWVTTPVFEGAIAAATPEELEAATTEVELADATFLLIGGGDDQLWPSCALAEIAVERLEESGHAAAHGDEYVCYPGAGHFVTGLPGVPTTLQYKSFHPVSKYWYALGGNPRDQAHAQRDLVGRVKTFLAARLAR
jgi:acetyl esterase/lipase